MVFRAFIQLFRVRKPQSSQLKKPIFLGKQLVPACKEDINTPVCSYALHIRNVSTAMKSLALRKANADKNNSSKAAIISSLNFNNVEDAAPFYKLPMITLYKIRRITIADVKNGFCKNRLYYISSRIQCPPAVLSEKLAQRSFVYKLSFQWIESSLNVLLDKGVSGDRILRDLWVLKYHHQTIDERLQRIKDHGVVTLFPWMVRCSPDILSRYLKQTQETKSILGDTNSTQMYLANRLNISIEDIEELSMKMPALRTIRAIKVKHFLDFLTEEGFDIAQIAKQPRILLSSQKTAKKRLEQLRQLGVTKVNLNVLCRSKKGYRRFCENLNKDGSSV